MQIQWFNFHSNQNLASHPVNWHVKIFGSGRNCALISLMALPASQNTSGMRLEKICQNLTASELRQVWVLSSWAPSPRWGRASAACGPATCKTQTSRCNKQKKTENRLPKSKCHFHIGTFAITWNCMETWPSRMHKSSQAHGLEAGTKKAEVHLLLLEPQRQSSTILLPQLKMVKKWKDCLGLHTTSQDCKFRIHHHL